MFKTDTVVVLIGWGQPMQMSGGKSSKGIFPSDIAVLPFSEIKPFRSAAHHGNDALRWRKQCLRQTRIEKLNEGLVVEFFRGELPVWHMTA